MARQRDIQVSWLRPCSRGNRPRILLMRQAKRLRKRLRKTSFLTPPLTELASALQERKILLGRYTKADLRSPDGNTFPAWEISLHRYPTWIKGTFISARAGVFRE